MCGLPKVQSSSKMVPTWTETPVFSYTPFTLQPVSPMVVGAERNTPVLQLLSKVSMAPCDTVAKCPLPCESHGLKFLLLILYCEHV